MMMRLGWLKDYTRPLWDHNIEAESTLKCSCAWTPRSLKTCCPSVSMHLSIPAQSCNLLREKLARKTVICWWVRGVEKWWRKWENIPFYNMSSLWIKHFQFSSVQFSRWVVSDSLRPHELPHARPPCPSPTPRVHSDSCPSSQWCHPANSSSVVPFSSRPQSLPASESFPMSQLLAWGGQSTGVSASASVSPKKSQGWSPSEWTGWISLQSKGLSRVFSNYSF